MSNRDLRPDEDETLDTFFHGRILILQKKRGYRFSADAPLLADFIRTRETDEILEIGTGSGVIPLLLSIKPFRKITSLEIQPGLADLARRNVLLNRLQDRIEIVRADLTAFKPPRNFDLIFSNPPYIKRGAGILSAVGEKAAAKHEVFCSLKEILEKAAAWLKKNGRACFIYPEKRRADFWRTAEACGLHVNRLRYVHPRAEAEPNLFLTELSFGSVRKTELPPLVLFGADGRYTKEAEEIFAGRS